MKLIYSCGLLLIAIFTAHLLHAQGAKEGKFRFAKADRPGMQIEYPYSEGIVENALAARLDKAGFEKPKSDNHFKSFQGVNWPEISPGQVDVYTKVDGKSNHSTVVLLLSKGYDNYVSSASDPVMSAKLKVFLESLLPDIQAGQLLADIGAQEEAVRKAEREYKDMDHEGNKQNREKEHVEKKVSDNAEEKAKRAEALEAEKAKLDALKAQTK